MALIDDELGPRPGPAGVPIRAVLVCLMISIHHNGKATLAEAWRLAAFCLSPTAREQLGLDADRPPAGDPHACLADNRRFYRAFDRLTTLLDPARHDRRTRLPQHEADLLATAWEDDDPDHTRKRNLLQEVVTALVLTPVRWGKGRGYLAEFRGDVGIDTTAAPVFARPPRARRSTGELFASTEIMDRPGNLGGYDSCELANDIADSCALKKAPSYSFGGILPQNEWSLVSLYQATHSMVSSITSVTPCQPPRKSMSSFLYRLF
ncbi:hypothetical protein ABGB18_33100, partial [Nonomuraea sp. B12E4]|uniref:hypothetical protein n=1 Tax=Nonomuraea sp. B12E4 TaxID=3153564 RepID=UPI00325DB42E